VARRVPRRQPGLIVHRFTLVLATAAACALAGAPDAVAAPAHYRVGIDVEPINPCPNGTWGGSPDVCGTGTVFLGGFGFAGGPVGAGPISEPSPIQGRPANGLLMSTDSTLKDADGAHVRAIAISAGHHPFLIADIEVQGWFVANKAAGLGLIDMRRKVAADLGISAQDIFIQSAHTHSGADAMGVWGGVPASFLSYMASQTETALKQAYRNRQPADLYYGSTEGSALLTNQFAGDPANQSLDSDVRVLQARNPSDGSTIATLLNFSAHGTVLGPDNLHLSGDWVQAANPLLEQRFGGRAITIVGTLGRTQPFRDAAQRACGDPTGLGDGDPATAFCRIERYAGQVVDLAALALSHATPLAGPPTVVAHSYLITDPASNPLLIGGDAATGPLGLPFNRSTVPPWLIGNVLGTVTGTARIGDVLLSSIPGEAYPQIALKVASLVTGIRNGGHDQDGFMTAGLSNDQLGYLIAPFSAYPQPMFRAMFTQQLNADVIQACVQSPNPPSFGNCPQPEPVSNDNYLFNVSHTIGQRVTCSLLRGADDALHPGRHTFWLAYHRCAAFVNDALLGPGADLRISRQTQAIPSIPTVGPS